MHWLARIPVALAVLLVAISAGASAEPLNTISTSFNGEAPREYRVQAPWGKYKQWGVDKAESSTDFTLTAFDPEKGLFKTDSISVSFSIPVPPAAVPAGALPEVSNPRVGYAAKAMKLFPRYQSVDDDTTITLAEYGFEAGRVLLKGEFSAELILVTGIDQTNPDDRMRVNGSFDVEAMQSD